MINKAHALIMIYLILGLTLCLPEASLATSEWMWCHGHSAKVEFPERTDWMRYRGWGLDFHQRSTTDNWVHFAVPTPAQVDALTVRARYIRIRFWSTQEGHTSRPLITDVHVYNGATLVREFANLNWRGTGTWQTKELDLGSLMAFNYGLGISIRVKAEVIILKDEAESLQETYRFIFAGAGARFEW